MNKTKKKKKTENKRRSVILYIYKDLVCLNHRRLYHIIIYANETL